MAKTCSGFATSWPPAAATPDAWQGPPSGASAARAGSGRPRPPLVRPAVPPLHASGCVAVAGHRRAGDTRRRLEQVALHGLVPFTGEERFVVEADAQRYAHLDLRHPRLDRPVRFHEDLAAVLAESVDDLVVK